MINWTTTAMEQYPISQARTRLSGDGKEWAIHTWFCQKCALYHTQVAKLIDVPEWAVGFTPLFAKIDQLEEGRILSETMYQEHSDTEELAALTHDRVIEQFKSSGIFLGDPNDGKA